MDVKTKLDTYFQKAHRKGKPSPTQVLVWSDKNNLQYKYLSEATDQPFHVASVGKMMTATLIGVLSDKKKLRIDDYIGQYLPDDVLKGLFVYKGVDHQNEVTIRHLLTHTSGIADYFESKPNAGSVFVDKMTEMPDKIWLPYELLDYTREYLSAKSAPGTFLYSDSGYILLGLIVENVTGKSFSDALTAFIFKPLGMNDSYLLFGGEPINTRHAIADIWFNGKEISKLNMLSCDWAGGGVVSTLSDLLLFQKAFWSGKLVSEEFRSEMTAITNKFRPGIHYGGGVMELHLEGFFFLLRGLPRPIGHSGILGTLMFYDRDNDVHIIMNLGSNKRVVESFRSIIVIEQIISKFSKKR